VHVEVKRIAPAVERAIRYIQKPDPAWAAKKLARRAGEEIAPQLRDIDRPLSDPLASVEEIWHSDCSADRADGLRVLHETRVCRNPRESDEAALRMPGQGANALGVHATLRAVDRAHDLDSEPTGEGQIHDLV